ncbi:MAG: methylated-DNA--[protein]-cysteine S-methyltransferase [Candidatus Binatia bacterium]
MKIEIAELASPVGNLTIAVNDGRLVGLCFEGLWPRRRSALEKRDANCTFVPARDPRGVCSRLVRYFDGALDALDDIDVEAGGTPFQRSVWQQLRRIAPGQTRSYAEIARAIGAPNAVRAVGAANGANPVGIVVPCHRVIGSDGKLTGFAGGLAAKRWLLEHEDAQGVLPASRPRAA